MLNGEADSISGHITQEILSQCVLMSYVHLIQQVDVQKHFWNIYKLEIVQQKNMLWIIWMSCRGSFTIASINKQFIKNDSSHENLKMRTGSILTEAGEYVKEAQPVISV